MQAGTESVAPGTATSLPSCYYPSVTLRRSNCGRGTAEDLVVIALSVEIRRSFEQNTNLRAQTAEGFPSVVAQPQLHLNLLCRRANRSAKLNIVRKSPASTQAPAEITIPVDVFHPNVLSIPNGRDMRVRQIS